MLQNRVCLKVNISHIQNLWILKGFKGTVITEFFKLCHSSKIPHVIVACPRCISKPHVQAASICFSVLHVCGTFTYRMFMLHVRATCMYILHVHPVFPCCMSLLHFYAEYLCCMPMSKTYILAASISLLHVHAACLWNVSLHVLTACPPTPHVHAACPCRLSILLVYVACPCCMSVLHFHAVWF
jgi:hypothetical protein